MYRGYITTRDIENVCPLLLFVVRYLTFSQDCSKGAACPRAKPVREVRQERAMILVILNGLPVSCQTRSRGSVMALSRDLRGLRDFDSGSRAMPDLTGEISLGNLQTLGPSSFLLAKYFRIKRWEIIHQRSPLNSVDNSNFSFTLAGRFLGCRSQASSNE